MNKKFIPYTKNLKAFLLLGLLGASNAYSQSLNLENVTKQGFQGLEPLDKSGYYIQYFEGLKKSDQGKKAIVHIYTLNNDLGVNSDFKLDLLPNDEIEDLSYNGGLYFLIYSNTTKKTRTFKLLDLSGKEVAAKVLEDVKLRQLEKPAVILPCGASDFLVVNYIKEKKTGYSIEKFNNKLEPVFSSPQIPEKAKLYPVDYFVADNKLHVLEFINRDLSDYFEYYVNSFDLSTGNSLSRHYLSSEDGKNFGYPGFIRPAKNGGVVTGGMYFDKPREQEANSDGFFSTYIPAQGKPVSTYKDWKDVKSQINNGSTSAMWGGKNKTFMHDIALNDDGSYVLIGENYRKGDQRLSGEKSKNKFAIASKALDISGGDGVAKEAVTAAEFVLIDFDASGNYKGIRAIDKPNCVTVINPSSDSQDRAFIGEGKGLNLANILNNYGYFPYRFIADKDGKKYLTYYLKHEKKPDELVYFTPLNASTAESTSVDITGSELKLQQEIKSKLANSLGIAGGLAKLNKLAKATGSDTSDENEFELRSSQDPFDFRAKKLNTRVYPSNVSGKVLVYDFAPQIEEGEKKSWLNKTVNTANGTLKIFYVDIPSK